jgi:hypothetical protein
LAESVRERPTTDAPSGEPPERARARSTLSRLAGPVLICGAVLLVLNGYAFRGLISIRHPDLLPFWYPTWCYLGKSLAAGHIPAWNPHVMGGVPFAADPQSGWGYLPAMALFAGLPCSVALRWIIVLHPLLAGVGLFAFLRSEGISRVGATVGGLTLALAVSGSEFVVYMPIAAMFAWTPILLAAASRLLRAPSWPGRLAWLGAAALAWGQLAAAHLSDGLVIGTGALVAYLGVHLIADVRAKRRGGTEALMLAALLVLAFPLLNAAILLPRLSHIPETSLAKGYRALQILNASLTGRVLRPLSTGGYEPTFPLKFATGGGVYLGGIALALAFAGWRARRFRVLMWSFSLFAAISYLIGLHAVAKVVTPIFGDSFIGTNYGHAVHRLSWGLIIALPILAAIGFEAWRARASPLARLTMIGPAILVWVVAPMLLGLHRPRPLVPAVGASVAAVALVLVAWRPRLALVIPLIVAAELSVNGLTVRSIPCCNDRGRPPDPAVLDALQPADRPRVRASTYERTGPIVRAIQRGQEGRYLSLDWPLWSSGVRRAPQNWPFMGTQRSMLFGIEEAQGYNPSQLLRYWMFIRAVQRDPVVYNGAYFRRVGPLSLDLLHVRYLIQPSDDFPAVTRSRRIAIEGGFSLYELADPSPPASFVASWQVVASTRLALDRILQTGFDPRAEAILERDPGIGPLASGRPASGPAEATGAARYVAEGEQAARIEVEAPGPGIVLVRIVFDRNWRATVDGRPAPVLAADAVVQGVPVGPGRHVIRLAYDDPALGHGLLVSGAAWAALVAAAFLFAVRDRRAARSRREREERLEMRRRLEGVSGTAGVGSSGPEATGDPLEEGGA